MELWVRTQDRERLGKIVFIEYAKDDYGHHLMGWKDRFDGTRIATYKTKERALEVLDEIQNILKPKVFLNSGKITGSFDNTIYREPDKVEIQELSVVVYEMPKE